MTTDGQPFSYGTVIPVIFLLVGLVVACENGLLLYIMLPNYRFHTSNYTFVISLGITDLLVGILSFSAGILRLPALRVHPPLLTCQMVSSIGMIFLSGVHMLAIAAERWLYIVHPFFYIRYVTERATWYGVAALWVTSFGYVLTAFVWQTRGFHLWPTEAIELNIYVKVIFVIFTYVVIMVVTFTLYFHILLVARKQRSQILAMHRHVHHRTSSLAHFMNEFIRSMVFLLTIFGVFIGMTIGPVIALSVSIFQRISSVVSSLIFLLLYFNSGCNFCAMLYLDQPFRQKCVDTVPFARSCFGKERVIRGVVMSTHLEREPTQSRVSEATEVPENSQV